jgi:hypothetical protein
MKRIWKRSAKVFLNRLFLITPGENVRILNTTNRNLNTFTTVVFQNFVL